ncbi:MAG: DUF4162 domain-containing protein, partial [Anaerolineales bacterium]|nr:DUF4162 domain-containing protein [Anaerolineales bacterium]
FHLAETADSFLATLEELPYVKKVQPIDNKLLVTLDDPEQYNPTMIRLLVDAGANIQFVGELRHSLEDVYLQLVNDE